MLRHSIERRNDDLSLLYWLPMLGSLKNQGLSEATPVNHGATINNSGKLGKYYSFSGSSQYIDTGFKESISTGDFTISAWVKLTSDTTKTYQPIISNKTTAANSVGFAIYFNHNQNKFLWSTADGTNATEIWTTNTFADVYNTWTHVVMVRNSSDPKIGYFYINGERQDLASVPPVRNITNATYNMIIGDIATHNNAAYLWTGDICDVRIYDEAIPPKLAKEISKGLVLHYPLNRGGFGGDNLFTGSKDFSGTWVNSGAWTTSTEKYKGFTVKEKSSQWGGITQNISCSNGDIFTISFYAKVESGGRICSIHRSSLGNVTTGLTILGGNFISGTDWINATDDGTQWRKYWGTVKINSSDITYLQWRIENSISGKKLSICGMKIEKGSIVTPWIPNSADTLYSSMGLDSNIEYDVSGYQNNGTITGTLNYSSDTPKYLASTAFDGTQKISTPSFTSEVKTMSVWVKTTKDKNTSQFVCADSASKLCISFYKGCIISYFASSGHSTGSKCALGSSYIENGWNHIVVVSTGSGTRDVYCNGVKLTPTTNDYWSYTSAGFTVGARNSNTPCYFYGYISDVRAYTTALSADDVLELYHTPVSIASNGTLLTQGEISEA